MKADKWCRRKTIMYNSLGVAIQRVLAWMYEIMFTAVLSV